MSGSFWFATFVASGGFLVALFILVDRAKAGEEVKFLAGTFALSLVLWLAAYSLSKTLDVFGRSLELTSRPCAEARP